MAQFIDLRDVRDFLDLHSLDEKPYYLATFLVGAYQEILGDLHNLFGDTDAVHVRLDGEKYSVEHVVKGDAIEDVLHYVSTRRRASSPGSRRAVEAALKEERLTMEESGRFMRRYEEALGGYSTCRSTTSRQRRAAGNGWPRRHRETAAPISA